ncbi:MAG: alpha/beta fold hydrolase [Propionibacteriaceae bacterium]
MPRLATTATDIGGPVVHSLSAGTVAHLPEVVLVPGLGVRGYLAPWARRISARTRSTLIDLPGGRWGRRHTCAPTVAAISATVARWLELTDRDRVVRIGHSTGAQCVVRTAQLSPERVAGVVLFGPTFDPSVRDVLSLVSRSLTTFIREPLSEVPAAVSSLLRNGAVPLGRFVLDALHDRPEDVLATLSTPVLIMTGRVDGLAPPEWARQLADLSAGRCVILPGSHNACYSHVEQADSVLASVMENWAGHQ